MSHVLIVEDSDSIALLLRRRLEMAGHSTARAGNGAEALEMLSGGEEVDLILLDVMMPRLSGPEAMREIRLVYPTLPVVLVTAGTREETEAVRADAVIRKPIDFDRLLGLIERLAGNPA